MASGGREVALGDIGAWPCGELPQAAFFGLGQPRTFTAVVAADGGLTWWEVPGVEVAAA